MRVFLTGATGYIGSAVLDALQRGGHRVTALVRDPEKAERLGARGVSAVIGEIGSPASYLGAFNGTEAVVHTAFEDSVRGVDQDRQAIETLLGALAPHHTGAARVFVYTSGIWVLGSTTRPADEAAPLDPAAHVAWRPAHEQRVLDAGTNGLRTVIIRPGIVYGGSRGLVSDLVKDAMNGLVRVIGGGKNRWPMVYDRDLADLYVRVLREPDARGVFHANDEADERVNDIVEAIGGHLSHPPEVRHMPMAEARRKLGAYAEALALDQRVRSPRARALGWAPTLSGVSPNIPRLLEEYRRDQK